LAKTAKILLAWITVKKFIFAEFNLDGN